MANITFEKKGNVYEAEIQLNEISAIHIDRQDGGTFTVQQTHFKGTKYTPVANNTKITSKNIDFDVVDSVFPVYLKITSSSPVENAEIIGNGKALKHINPDEVEYLGITAIEPCQVGMMYQPYKGGPYFSAPGDLMYSFDSEEWLRFTGNPITLNPGESIFFFRDDTSPLSSSATPYYFVINGKARTSGSVMSIVGFREDTDNHIFVGLFRECDIVNIPKLPSLTTANACYTCMFEGCKYLSETPELPALYVDTSAYHCMFEGCTSLNSIKIYAENINTGRNAVSEILANCASNGVIYKKSCLNVDDSENFVPDGWEVVNFDE